MDSFMDDGMGDGGGGMGKGGMDGGGKGAAGGFDAGRQQAKQDAMKMMMMMKQMKDSGAGGEEANPMMMMKMMMAMKAMKSGKGEGGMVLPGGGTVGLPGRTHVKGEWAPNEWNSQFKPHEYWEEPGGKVGIEGLRDAVTRAVDPHVESESFWSKEDMVNRIAMKIYKVAERWWWEDARHKEAGTAVQAKGLLEEFTNKIMGELANNCYDKPWFQDIYLSESIALAAINTFKGGLMFKRTVAPIIVSHIDEAVFRYREEERHQTVMWEALANAGIKQEYIKKATKHMLTSFETAHVSARYGHSAAETPEMGIVQDFVRAWIQDFYKRGGDVMTNGINNPTDDQQIAVLSTLFSYLCDPAHSILPHELVSELDAHPPSGWDYIGQASIEIVQGW